VNQGKGIDVRVLFVSDSQGPPALDDRVPPAGSPRAHADSDLVDALQSSGIEIARADWTDLARGAVDLDGVDLVHLRPAVLRRGPRSGDRRGHGRRLPFGRRPSVQEAVTAADRRTAAGLLSHVPLDLPIVLTLPARPAGPVALPAGHAGAGDPQPAGAQPSGSQPPEHRLPEPRMPEPRMPEPRMLEPRVLEPRMLEPGPGAPGSRPVHVIAADSGAASGLDAVLPAAHAASVAVIGRGFGEPRQARPFDVDSAVVLASTSPGSAREAAAVLRAVEMLGHAGLRFSLVLAGVGPMVRGVQRRVALAEAAGIDVRLLGRASADELARWRATASACVVTSREPGAQREVADVLLSGIPVVATLDPVHADVAAQTNVLPRWFAEGDAAGLASALLECLPTAPESLPGEGAAAPDPTAGPEPTAGPGPDAGSDGPLAASGGGVALLARSDAVPVEPVAVPPVEVRPDDRVLPTWDDIADQTRWVYQQALRSRRS
jgi:hypothetical protein